MSGIDLSKLNHDEMVAQCIAYQRLLCQKHFRMFVKHAWHPATGMKFIDGWHMAAVAYHMQALIEDNLFTKDGEIADVLVVNLPSGCGKSGIASVLFHAWKWANDPTYKLWMESFEPKLSSRLGTEARDFIKGKWFQDRWPVELSGDQDQKQFYRSVAGGWRVSLSIGSGAGLGWHPNAIIVDDPHNPKQGLDPVKAELAQEKWRGTLSSRGLVGGVKKVVIAQRLGEYDLSAYVIENEKRCVLLRIPMWFEPDNVCETKITYTDVDDADENGMFIVKHSWRDPRTKAGELMWPEGMPEHKVEQLKQGLRNAHAVSGQMQQNPTSPEGDFFKAEWFNYVDSHPKKGIAIRAWDKAASTGRRADYTAGVLVIYDGDYFYIVDVVRGKWGRKERDEIILATAEKDSALVGSYVVLFEQEPGSGGKESAEISATQLRNAGFTVRIERPTSKKHVMWEPFAREMEHGRVKICRAAWNAVFESELLSAGPDGVFGKHDDMIDAAASAVRKAAKGNGIGRITRPLLLLTEEEQKDLGLDLINASLYDDERTVLGVRI